MPQREIMRLLYNFFFNIFLVLSAPYYFLKMWRRGHWREGFRERFGHYSVRTKHALTNRHVLWVHAVSVGEVNLCTQLIRLLESKIPNTKIVVSTTTSTGMGELHKKLPSRIEKVYYPIDRRHWVVRAISSLHPQAIILVEAEIWPNLLWRARERGIPVFLVNARMSERSYRGYKTFGSLSRPLFASLKAVGAQNETDAARLRQLGCRPDAIHLVGNMKFDAAKLEDQPLADFQLMLRQLGVPPQARILIGGSTHAGEENILAEQFLRLRRSFPDLFLILVPRHFERGKEIGRELAARGLKFVYRTAISPTTQFKPGQVDCLLVNTTGELKFLYRFASVIFVGKSLTAHGGQNPIEPGSLGKAMVFGPHMQNFDSITSAFLAQKAAIQVANAAELETTLAHLLADQSKRAELGRNARKVVQENQGSIERTVQMILNNLGETEIYVAEP